jgi:hypothetical protein
MLYEIEYHVISEGSRLCGGPSQTATIEASSEEDAVRILRTLEGPGVRVGHIVETDEEEG